MKKIYHPHFPGTIILIAIISWFISLQLFFSWKSLGSLMHLVFAILFLLVFIACSKPLIEWKRIEIENGYITIFKRFFKPLKIKISESLYQIVIQDDKIRSFRFKYGEYQTQISPVVYKNGDEMTETIVDFIKKHKIIVDAVIK